RRTAVGAAAPVGALRCGQVRGNAAKGGRRGPPRPGGCHSDAWGALDTEVPVDSRDASRPEISSVLLLGGAYGPLHATGDSEGEPHERRRDGRERGPRAHPPHRGGPGP